MSDGTPHRFTLTIGDKNWSSWSLRPWLLMKVQGIAFEEQSVSLKSPLSRVQLAKASASALVPTLYDHDLDLEVWDSLAIIDHLADQLGPTGIWPDDPRAKARARSITAEMHSGFGPLRDVMFMNCLNVTPMTDIPADVERNIRRIETIWTETRERFGPEAEGDGPFLFGAFSAADAFYAPVVSRFITYEVPVNDSVRAYMDTVWTLPEIEEWLDGARVEMDQA